MTDNQSIRTDGKFINTARTGIGVLIAYAVYSGRTLPFEQIALGVIIMILAAWPGLRWLRTQPYQFPAFETFMLTGITAYALPLLSEHEILIQYPDRIITAAAICVVLFQLCALFAFYNTQTVAKRSPFWIAPLFTRDISSWLPIGMWLNLSYILISQFTDLIPSDINSVLRAAFFGISTSCSFLLGRAWGEGRMSSALRASVGIVLVAQTILLMSTLYLITAISSLLIFLLAYVTGGKRLPVVTLVLIFVVLSVLHNGKSPMRDKYWDEYAPEVELTDLPAFFTEWVTYGLNPQEDKTGEIENKQLLERASLLHMLCLVIDSHDNRLPLLMGETYGHVPAQLIPRFFWPGKPSGQVTSARLGIYFGLQDESSALTTSIAFGELAEAYANFAYYGLALLGFFIGWANKLIVTWTKNSPLISNGGFLMILLMAWSVQIELPMSNWVASFFQASICVLGIPYVLQRMFSK